MCRSYLRSYSGLRLFHLVRGEYATSLSVSEQFLQLAQQQQDPALIVEAKRSIGAAHFWSGELTQAKEYFLQWLGNV